MKKWIAWAAAVLVAAAMLLPVSAVDNRIVYAEDFDDVPDFSSLGWTVIDGNTATWMIEDGKLLVDNLAGGRDSYVVMVPDSIMRTVIEDDYTVQYDLTYLEAGDQLRYLAVLLNFDRKTARTYNSLHIRIKGNGNWQNRNAGNWLDMDASGVDGNAPIANEQPGMTIAEMIMGVPFDNQSYALRDLTMTVRQEIDVDAGVRIYVNDIFVTGTDAEGWRLFCAIADPVSGYSEIALKAGATICGYFDNFTVATGLGIPAPETTAPPVTAPPADTAAVPETTVPQTGAADTGVGASVYALAVLLLATSASVLFKRNSAKKP